MALTVERYQPGLYQQISWSYHIGPNLGATAPWFQTLLKVALSADYSGIEVTKVSMLWRVTGKNAQGAVYSEDKIEFDSADSLRQIRTKSVQIQHVIPNSAIAGKAGGKIKLTLSIASGSTGPDIMHGVPTWSMRFGPQPVGVANGWSEV